VQAALEKRGITDMSQVMVDVWAGFYDDPKRRIGRPLLFLKTPDQANFYSRPIDGIIVIVDLNEMKVLEVKDIFDTPIPPPDPTHEWQNLTNFRKDLKPIHITQPEGVSYRVEGNKVFWQKWQFRVNFNAREGLVLNQIGYEDKGRVRPILYQAR
jgi:primary-amine oxidase